MAVDGQTFVSPVMRLAAGQRRKRHFRDPDRTISSAGSERLESEAPLLRWKACLSSSGCLVSTLRPPGRVNSKDWVVLRDGFKRGHKRVVWDRQVVPTARGDLAPSLKDGRPLL